METNLSQASYKKGDNVLTSLGRGEVTGIDNTTYSVEMYFVELTGGHHTGEIIVKPAGDLLPDK